MTVIIGYALLDEAWQPLGFARFDEGDVFVGKGVARITCTVLDVKVAALPPGMAGVGCVGGPYTATQAAVIRDDGTPACAVDLAEPIVVGEGEWLERLRVDVRMIEAT